MPSFVEEIETDIERITHFCDVRDLMGVWEALAGDDVPELGPLMAAFPDALAERVMLLSLCDDTMTYERIGRHVTSLFGHDPTGQRVSDIRNPGIQPFLTRYRSVALANRPLLAIQHEEKPNVMGAHERLMLPVRSDGTRQLLVYVRSRGDAGEILRSVFDASTESITVLQAMRDETGRIFDFMVGVANAESGRRMNMRPDAMIGKMLTELFPFANAMGLIERLARSVEDQETDVFDTRYPQRGAIVERQLRLAPQGDRLTVTNVDLGPLLAASRAVEKQRNELLTANTLLECRARDLKASNEALEKTAGELREEIARNRILEKELVHLAHFDRLTGLPNRSSFEKRYAEVLKAAEGTRRKIALCILDIDHFKEINDRFGHSTGDAVLREIASRLLNTLRRTDVVGRLGGDEFAVLLTDALDIEDARAAVHRVVETVMQPLSLLDQEIPMSFSAGVAIYPADAHSEAELMGAADLAVYRAKRTGRGHPVFFTPSMREEADQQRRLIRTLGRGIARGEVVPFYQPLMDLHTGQLIGFEALARWQHPDRGLLSPGAFLDALEEPDVARALTSAMIDGVLADLRRWSRGNIPAHVSVNITAFDLRLDGFAADLEKRLSASGLSPRQLAIEVTETTVLSRDAERITQTLSDLQKRGFSISLDDFGTGYASLSHLLSLPANSLKIDRSFIADIESNPKTTAIVRSIISLAAALGLDVVAEGIETRTQLDIVRSLGCHLVQGYLISAPMPASSVPGFIASFTPQPAPEPLPVARTG